MPPGTLSDWLDLLERTHGSSITLGLTRMHTAVSALNLLPLSIPVITVAGTNGKGSVVCALESIYTQAGYRVGSYTSPHLFAFNERFKLNTKPVSDESIIKALSATHATAIANQLTYFETITLAAIWLFKQTPLDVLILEIGLGGRLDAVNVIDPSLAVITNIDLDHTDRLGDSRDAIATEKAGIFREKTPVICGDKNPPTILKEMAARLLAPFILVQQEEMLPDNGLLPENMRTAVTAIRQLQSKLPVSQQDMMQGLKQCHLPGRQQIVYKQCKHLFDVAHNPAGLEKLAQRIAQEKNNGRVLLVISMLTDKDLLNSFNTLKSQIDHWYIAPLSNERAANITQLKSVLTQLEIENISEFMDIQQAYQAAMQEAQSQDLIVITGSFLTVAAVFSL
jgi:dihydrofolate synthase / folylpolyglutamate synthase